MKPSREDGRIETNHFFSSSGALRTKGEMEVLLAVENGENNRKEEDQVYDVICTLVDCGHNTTKR